MCPTLRAPPRSLLLVALALTAEPDATGQTCRPTRFEVTEYQPGQVGGVFLGDVDGNGDLDIVVNSSSSVRVMPGDGAGGFGAAIVTALQTDATFGPVVGDVTLDGRADFLHPDAAGSDMNVYPGQTDFVFDHLETFAAMGYLHNVTVVADVNGDTRNDVVTGFGDFSPGGFSVLFGQADGTLLLDDVYGFGPDLREMSVGDLDDDGFPDLVIGDTSDKCIRWNDGSGGFTTGPCISPSNSTGYVVIADANGDDADDMILLHFAPGPGSEFHTYLGPLGAVLPAPVVSVGSGLFLTVADLDGDSVLDLVSAGGGGVLFAVGQGDGTFGPQSALPLGDFPGAPQIGDVDHDGRDDVVLRAGGSVWVLRNRGPDFFVDEGGAVAGSAGTPVLTGTGDLCPGEPYELSLQGAAPSAPAYLVIGTSALLAPFKGGTLVPSPDIVIPLITDVTGAILAPATLDLDAPQGAQLWAQFWIVDGGAPFGFAASNGLRMILD